MIQTVIELVKLEVGITTDSQDERLELLTEGVIKELEEDRGIKLNLEERQDHLLFVVDYVAFRYEKPLEGMPRHLIWRMRELYLKSGGRDV